MKVVGYVRVSKEDQARSGLGIEAQETAILEFAAREYPDAPLILNEDSRDEGLSGALPVEERPALQSRIKLLSPGDVLIVAKRDRVARDLATVILIENMVAARGARLVSTRGEGTEDDEPESYFIRRLLDLFAEYERLITKKRTKLALAEKKRRGEWVGRPPFGWDVEKRGEDGRAGRYLIPNEREQRALALMRVERAAGESLEEIAKKLNALGYATKKGRPWNQDAVYEALKYAPPPGKPGDSPE